MSGEGGRVSSLLCIHRLRSWKRMEQQVSSDSGIARACPMRPRRLSSGEGGSDSQSGVPKTRRVVVRATARHQAATKEHLKTSGRNACKGPSCSGTPPPPVAF